MGNFWYFMRMKNLLLCLLLCLCAVASLRAQTATATVLTGADLKLIVPTSFYFEGQNAPTQIRNSSAVRFVEKRVVIAGLVDTSGYASDVSAKYQGFFITDSRIKLGGKQIATGAYGFGFTNDGKLNIFDIGGNQIVTTKTLNDKTLRRPRPLLFVKTGNEIRFYSGREYVVITSD